MQIAPCHLPINSVLQEHGFRYRGKRKFIVQKFLCKVISLSRNLPERCAAQTRSWSGRFKLIYRVAVIFESVIVWVLVTCYICVGWFVILVKCFLSFGLTLRMGGVRIFHKVVTEMRGSLVVTALALLALSTVTALQTKGKLTYLTSTCLSPAQYLAAHLAALYLPESSDRASLPANQPTTLAARVLPDSFIPYRCFGFFLIRTMISESISVLSYVLPCNLTSLFHGLFSHIDSPVLDSIWWVFQRDGK